MAGPEHREQLAKGNGDLVCVKDAAHRVGVTEETVRGWIAQDHLPVTDVNGRIFINLNDLLQVQDRRHAGHVIPAWREAPARIGARLRKLREASGLNQQELSELSGVSNDLISHLERGLRSPQIKSVRALASALGIHPIDFVSATEIGQPSWSARETANWLDVPIGRIYKWLKRGELGGRKVSGEWRISITEVMALEASKRLRGRSRRLDPRFSPTREGKLTPPQMYHM